ncbi:MAG TPA: hypothetical protein VIK62_08975 [Verrucomicrobiae bacterium]
MNNWKVIFATVVIFGAGVITGGLLVNYVQHSRSKAYHKAPEVHASATNQPASNQVVRATDAPKLRPPEILSKQFLLRLKGDLHLAPEQNEAIQKIIAEGQNQIRKTIMDSRLEIRDVLTPDQQKQFDELMKRPFRKAIFNTNAPTVFSSATNSMATNSP